MINKIRDKLDIKINSEECGANGDCMFYVINKAIKKIKLRKDLKNNISSALRTYIKKIIKKKY